MEKFIDILLNKCGSESVLEWFQPKIEETDKSYTNSITEVANNVRKNTVLALVSGRNQCFGVFANCYVELKERQENLTRFGDLCYNETDATEIANTKERRDTFTFLTWVKLLSYPEFNRDDDKKMMIRTILYNFFNQDGDGKKLPTLETDQKCKDSFQEIRSTEFKNYDLKSQLGNITFVRSNCIDLKIYDDYKNDIIEKELFLTECFLQLEDQCYNGNLLFYVL